MCQKFLKAHCPGGETHALYGRRDARRYLVQRPAWSSAATKKELDNVAGKSIDYGPRYE